MGYFAKLKNFVRRLGDGAVKVTKRILPLVDHLMPLVKPIVSNHPIGLGIMQGIDVGTNIARQIVGNNTKSPGLKLSSNYDRPQIDSPRIRL